MHDETKRPENLISLKPTLTGGKSLIRISFMFSGKRELSVPFQENTGTLKMKEAISVLPAERLCSCQRPSTTPVQVA